MGVYGSGKVCPYEDQECDPETEGMNLEPEIEEQMAENRDYDQLAYYWQKWRDATGRVYRLDSGLVLSNLNTLRKQSSHQVRLPELRRHRERGGRRQRVRGRLRDVAGRVHRRPRPRRRRLPRRPRGAVAGHEAALREAARLHQVVMH